MYLILLTASFLGNNEHPSTSFVTKELMEK